VGRGEVPFKVQ